MIEAVAALLQFEKRLQPNWSSSMRNINPRLSLALVLSLSFFMTLPMTKNSDAGEYFTYLDLKGNLVLSNSAPPAGSQTIRRETLLEVSDQQIAESRVREEKMGLDNRLASLEKSIDELSDHIRAQNEIIDGLQQGYGDGNVAVGVTQGPAIGVRPPRRYPPRDFRNNVHSAQPRGTTPAPRQRFGGRARS